MYKVIPVEGIPPRRLWISKKCRAMILLNKSLEFSDPCNNRKGFEHQDR